MQGISMDPKEMVEKNLGQCLGAKKACSNNHYEDQNCVPNENLTFKVKEIESNFHKID